VNLKTIDKLFELQALKGSNAKKDFLKQNAGDSEFKSALKFCIDTQNIVSGIADKKLKKEVTALNTYEAKSLTDLMDYVAENNSGKDVVVAAVQKFASKYDERTRDGIYNVISQNFKTGVDTNNANAVYGADFVVEFKVMLANKYFDDVEYWNDKVFMVQSKLDGYRTVLIKENGVVTLKSRNGKTREGLPEIVAEAEALPYDNFVLDGELQPLGFDSMDNREAYKKTSEATKKGEKTGMCLAVYDFVPLADWNAKNCLLDYSERYALYLEMLKGTKFLVALEGLYIGTDSKKIVTLLNEAKADHKEGVMVKDMAGKYVWDRGNEIVKVKVFHDIDVVIEGWEYGTGKNKNTCGSIFFTYKGNPVHCGTGFTDDVRNDIAANFEKKYKGQLAEVIFFEETTDKTGKCSLRFPTWKGLKINER
jgi:DNA ligase-1